MQVAFMVACGSPWRLTLPGRRSPCQRGTRDFALLRNPMLVISSVKGLHRSWSRAFRATIFAGAALAAAMAQAETQTPVRFSLDWRFEGPAAPFTVALD